LARLVLASVYVLPIVSAGIYVSRRWDVVLISAWVLSWAAFMTWVIANID